MLPIDQFLNFIKQEKLFSPVDRVLIAVSGGRDSVLLTHLFNAVGFSFGIAHCNFRLRDTEADADEAFTRELAKRFNVPFFSITFHTSEYASENKLSIQMAARELRYKWFEETRKANGYDYIALAHHLSDTTETVLLNLTRGTGISGLHGILPRRGKLIRPLLFLSKEEIDGIVAAQNIRFREDSSNLSAKYARNKIRLEVIPKLKELNPHLDETFEGNSKRFLQVEEFLDQQVSSLRDKLFKTAGPGIFEIDLEELQSLKPLALLLFELFKPWHFSEAVLQDLIASWKGIPGKRFESPAHLLVLDRGKLILSEKIQAPRAEVLINEPDTLSTFEEVVLSFKTQDASAIQISAEKSLAFFDADMLQYPLKLRQWKTGDFFYPFGMHGKKKVSDFFTGLKISLPEKEKIPLLVNGNGDILWVVGYRTDERYKVGAQTKKVITFEKS